MYLSIYLIVSVTDKMFFYFSKYIDNAMNA